MAERLPRMDEDCIDYFLFPTVEASPGKSVKEALEELADNYMAFLSPYLIDYIWQNEAFHLQVIDVEDQSIPVHLRGSTNFGDNIDDEWFIVFLLNELSKKFSDLIIRCVDNDGEFLLIEMADDIPKWMTPDNTEKRVFIYQGNVHVLPKTKKLDSTPTTIIKQAVDLIKQHPSKSECSKPMQRRLIQRLSRFPEKIKENYHRAHCYVPAALAVILKQYPAFLPSAVKAFYLRDPIDLKACKMMKYFPPETRVLTDVTFTRCLYAQLVQQSYKPDRLIGWNIPPPHSPLFTAYDFGMKLACGFEILVANRGEKRDSMSSAHPNFEDARWLKFLNNLKNNNYFKDEVEGSKLYQERLEVAFHYYKKHVTYLTSSASIGYEILNLLETLEVDLEQLKMKEKQLSPPDDDNWMDITAEDMEKIVNENYSIPNNNFNSTAVDGLNEFIHHSSGLDGVEVPKMRESSTKNNNKANRITLDPDAFSDAYQSILDLKLPDWEEGSSSEMSDYSEDDFVGEVDLSRNAQKNGRKEKSQEMLSKMGEYMEQMDKELSATCVGQTFEQKPASSEKKDQNATKDETEDFENYSPVDVDLSALRNILESYHSQQGMPGPASTLMNSMGIHLPFNGDK